MKPFTEMTWSALWPRNTTLPRSDGVNNICPRAVSRMKNQAATTNAPVTPVRMPSSMTETARSCARLGEGDWETRCDELSIRPPRNTRFRAGAVFPRCRGVEIGPRVFRLTNILQAVIKSMQLSARVFRERVAPYTTAGITAGNQKQIPKPFAIMCGNSRLECAGIELVTSACTLLPGGATMNNKSMLIGFFGVLLALVTPHSAPAQSSRLPQLKLAVSTATPHNTPLWVAKDKKIFDKYGVDVQMIFVMGGALVSQMLAAGEIHVAGNAPAALDHLGLDAKRDNIILMQTGLDPERMAALEGKGLDAAMLQRLATKTMLNKGYTQLLNLNHAKIPYQNTVLASRRDYMAANPKLFDSFTRAIVEGYGYVFNKENKQAVKEVLAKNS